jgi:mannitol/fructose-specific phosphotransferase system IIA component (Ntr-type)
MRCATLNVEPVTKSIFAREDKKSSGCGKGIAVPHLIGPDVHELVIIVATFEMPVEWKSADNKPVTVAGMILAPTRYLKEYFPLMTQLAKTLADDSVKCSLLSMNTSAQMCTVLKAAKDRYA